MQRHGQNSKIKNTNTSSQVLDLRYAGCMKTFIQKTTIPVSQQSLYDWHASKVAFSRLLPPWENIEIQDWKGGEATQNLSKREQWGDLSLGAQVHLKTKVGPFWHILVPNSHIPTPNIEKKNTGFGASWRHLRYFTYSWKAALAANLRSGGAPRRGRRACLTGRLRPALVCHLVISYTVNVVMALPAPKPASFWFRELL